MLRAHAVQLREHARALGRIDEALVGIGTCDVDAPLRPGENFFSLKQFARAQKLGAVGQVNLRFIDANGNAVPSELDELVIGSVAMFASSAREIVWLVARAASRSRSMLPVDTD